MRFSVRELRTAKADKRQIFEWLYGQSRAGASAWLAAYDAMIERLENGADTFGEACENADLDMDVKQALFKTRKGRISRALFIVEAYEVFVIRVRGPGQAPVSPTDIGQP
jgi:hypothetical protein